jgi:hypothetical protein
VKSSTASSGERLQLADYLAVVIPPGGVERHWHLDCDSFSEAPIEVAWLVYLQNMTEEPSPGTSFQ